MCVYCAFRFILNFLYTQADKGLKEPKHVACILTQFCQNALDSFFTKYFNHSGMSSIEFTVPQFLLTNFSHFIKPYSSLSYPQQPVTYLRSKLNPLHGLSYSLFKIHFNIILPSTDRSSNCSLSFMFANQILNFSNNPIIRNYTHWTAEAIGNKAIFTYYFNTLRHVTV